MLLIYKLINDPKDSSLVHLACRQLREAHQYRLTPSGQVVALCDDANCHFNLIAWIVWGDRSRDPILVAVGGSGSW